MLVKIDKYTHANDLVLDTQYPGIDDNSLRITKLQFYNPYNVSSSDTVHIRGLQVVESMWLYIGRFSSIKQVVLHRVWEGSDKRIVFSTVLPVKSATASGDVLTTNIISPLLHYKDNSSTNTVSCMVTQPLPSTDNWIEAYKKDHDTTHILKYLQSKAGFSEKGLCSLTATYRHPLREKHIKLLNSRIIIMNPIGSINRFLTLIVVAKDIRRIIFHAYHTTPIGVHAGRYKTLLIVRL